jgi:hypothetical protein
MKRATDHSVIQYKRASRNISIVEVGATARKQEGEADEWVKTEQKRVTNPKKKNFKTFSNPHRR